MEFYFKSTLIVDCFGALISLVVVGRRKQVSAILGFSSDGPIAD